MKNLREIINQKIDRLDLQWRALPLRTQYRYVIVLFTFYLIMGIGVLVKVCYDLGRENQGLTVQHIEPAPVVKNGAVKDLPQFNNNEIQQNGRERE